MGFRSTFVTEDKVYSIPYWFLNKWGQRFHFYNNGKDDVYGFPIYPVVEFKTYWTDAESYKTTAEKIHEDIQRVLKEQKDYSYIKMILVWLHECGGITRVQIEPDRIVLSEPVEWEHHKTDFGHHYCYGCSNAKSEGKG